MKSPIIVDPAYLDPQKFDSTPAYSGAPKAAGRKRFKPEAKPILYTLYDQHKRRNFDHDALFYVFPDSHSGEEVPAGYVVVGGADYNTYIRVYNSPNRTTSLETEIPQSATRVVVETRSVWRAVERSTSSDMRSALRVVLDARSPAARSAWRANSGN